MPSLTVRRLLVDLDTPFALRWNGGDAFRSAFFNALSMSFPAGEQFFIDAVRTGLRQFPPDRQTELAAAFHGFVGQEATHRRIHERFNAHLAQQGFDNTWERRILRRTQAFVGLDARHAVAITAATEHFTAIFAEHLLATPAMLAGAEPRLRSLWQWHAAEESEHRDIAFDLYRELGGDEPWRRRWMRNVTLSFLTDLLRQTLRNLRRDGALLEWRTWRSAASFLFGRDGLVRSTYRPWRAYFAPDFHPSAHVSSRGVDWLRVHDAQWSPVAPAR